MLRKELADAGLDAGAGDHRLAPAAPPRPTSSEIDHRAADPDPLRAGHPRASGSGRNPPTIRFEASMPNETWQSDFTHYRLTRHRPADPAQTCRDHHLARRPLPLRPARHPHTRRVTTPIVLQPPSATPLARHGIPASTLTDNGMVYTVRLGRLRPPGRQERLRGRAQSTRHIVQKNSRPGHGPPPAARPSGSSRRMKKWLRAQPVQPTHARTSSRHCSTASSTSTTTADRTDRCPTGRHRRRLYKLDAESHCPDRDREPRDPRPGPPRHRVDQPAHVTLRHRRPPAPRRRRTNLRRNLRHPARPRPARSASSTPHRRAPPRTHHRPQHATTSHACTKRPPRTPNEEHPNLRFAGPGVRDVLRHHMVGLTGFEPAASSSRTKRATKLRHSPIGPPERAGGNHTRAPPAP